MNGPSPSINTGKPVFFSWMASCSLKGTAPVRSLDSYNYRIDKTDICEGTRKQNVGPAPQSVARFDYSDRPLKTGWYHVLGSGEGVERQLGDSLTYYLHPRPVVTAAHFKTVRTESFPHDSTLWQVVVHLDEHGRELFAKATEEHIGKDLVFVLDDSLWDEPVRIQGKIPNGVIVVNKKGRFSKEEAEELRNQIVVSKRE